MRTIYRRILTLGLITAMLLSLAGCNANNGVPSTTSANSNGPQSPDDNQELTEEPYTDGNAIIKFSCKGGFYSQDLLVGLTLLDTEHYKEIYYTLDGSVPNEASTRYESPIELKKQSGNYPKMSCIRAVALSTDGSLSEVSSQGYLVSSKADTRFSTPIFCLWGDPAELTDQPDGILSGNHNYDRGREWEREVYLEVYDENQNLILSQNAGARLYGGASRNTSLKSLKLYARKSYDQEASRFELDLFQTPNSEGGVIDSYKRLVLRNCGNDFQFAFLRDEYVQYLAQIAGYPDYEACLPVLGYVNGEYYNYYWLHENYCDEYFQEKYGKSDGTYYILEGKEQEKDLPGEEDMNDQLAKEYNDWYQEICEKDLTKDAEYLKVTEFIDVENYLDYYALNVYICNADWPHNNYKCYRYVPAEGESLGEGVKDGRYRFLPHDMDYSFGLYEQAKVMAQRDNLSHILNKNDEQYSPLFAGLMEREDCRAYFVNKVTELMNGVLSAENGNKYLDELIKQRAPEMTYYEEYLYKLRDSGNEDIWHHSDHLEKYTDILREFLNKRPNYMQKFLKKNLPV